MNEPRGRALLNDPTRNKSTAFTREERRRYGLEGLLPYNVADIEEQKRRVLGNLRRKESDIERYIFLNALEQRNQVLFYRVLIDHIEEIMPVIYTPTVGQACREFAHIFRTPQGFYVTPEDRGEIRRILGNWPEEDVQVIVVTDGERILGLGDLGANGMGIPIGKLELYVACGGISPARCMPVMLDVGTNNESLREDPLYLGYPHPRLTGEVYDSLVEEFIAAVEEKYPKALIQFEDFLSPQAFRLLERYGRRTRCFNDDIQGTAAVCLAGLLASERITGQDFADLRILFLGAGSAAIGIAELIVTAFRARGLGETEARARVSFVDEQGLITTSRDDVNERVKPFAHDGETMSFPEAVDAMRPHVLIGATGVAGTFTEDVIRRMADINERPVIFALSNPTSRAECTAEQAYRWTEGRAVFASGSPFAPVTLNGRTFRPAQGNNAHIFPGVGLGVLAGAARLIPDSMFLAAAETLGALVSDEQIAAGALYPDLRRAREISCRIAAAVCEVARREGLAEADPGNDPQQAIRARMYDPSY